jgi:lysophospholipase L1-like esterase
MKEILCFGDSNTWGWDPETKERFDPDTRWPGTLQNRLGTEYHVIEEGLNGRTTVWDDPIELHKKASDHLPFLLETHRPMDLIIIMLGTNDLKIRFSVTAYDIAQSIGTLIDIVQKSDAGRDGDPPEILVMAPPPLGRLTEYAEMFTGGLEKSKNFGKRYEEVADEYGVAFLDAGAYIKTSDIDGVHFERQAHTALGDAVAKVIKKMV